MSFMTCLSVLPLSPDAIWDWAAASLLERRAISDMSVVLLRRLEIGFIASMAFAPFSLFDIVSFY